MDILYLITSDLESPYGLGRIFPLARELVRLGHHATIAALHSDFSSLQEKSFVKDGVNIHYVAQMHVMKRGDQKIYFSNRQLISLAVNAAWKLSSVAQKTPADIIHIGKPHPMNGFAGLINKYLRGKQYSVDCDDYEAASGRFNGKLQKLSVEVFEKLIPRHAAAITVNTDFMRNKLISWGISTNKIYNLPNGVDLDRFQSQDVNDVYSLSKQLGLDNKRVVSFIGSMGLASHGIDLLIKAFVKVNTQFPDTRLMLVGGGEDLNQLRILTKELGIDQVTLFCGRIPPAEIPPYYHLSNVSVDPVYDDDAARGRSPLKLFESWAAGVPFVTGDVGDRRRILGIPSAGVLARPGDPESLADCILELLLDQNRSNQMRNLGYDNALDYTWEKIAMKLEEFYRKVLSQT